MEEQHQSPDATLATPEVVGVAVPQDEVDAIVALVAEVERSQQQGSPDAFMAAFRSDTVWTTAHGKRLTGFDEISKFTHHVLPAAADLPITATYDVELILFVRPDIAAVKVRQRPITRDGERLDEQLGTADDPAAAVAAQPDSVPGTPLYVLAKDDGVWRIAAAQNTKVIDPETLTSWSQPGGV